jgi:hypothetical protein
MKKISNQTMGELGIPTNSYVIAVDEKSDVTIYQASQGGTMWIWVVQKTAEIYDVDKFEYSSSHQFGPELTEYDNTY